MPDESNLYLRGSIWWMRATVNSVEQRESLRTSDVKIARALRDKRLQELKNARYFGIVRRSWKEAVAAWAERAAGQIAATTARRYAVSLLQVEPFLAPYDIDKIDQKVIAGLVSVRLRQATPATIRRDLTAVSRVLDFAEAEGWRDGNPALTAAKRVKERRDPIVLPDPGDVEYLIRACSRRYGPLVRAAWLTGARQDEIVRATWSSFNARAGTLEIIGKGNKRRTLRLSPEGSAHLSAQPVTLGCPLIFCKDSGEPFGRASADFNHFRRKAIALARKEGRPFRRFRFHDLRHLFAVEALRGGMSIYVLQKHLGRGIAFGIRRRHWLGFAFRVRWILPGRG
jgi:integrase/recombinase XerD